MSALTATTNDNVFTLLSKQNKLLGGPGASTSDNEFTLLSKNNVLLGGQKALASDTVFTLLSKQNKLLGGPGASTADRTFNLLSRQNKLLGGPGANTNDNVFTLLAKNNALFQTPSGPPATVVQTATGVWTSGSTIAATFQNLSISGNTILVHSTAADGTITIRFGTVTISGSGNSGAFANIASQTPGGAGIGIVSADAAPAIVASPANKITVTVTFIAGTITAGSITIHELSGMPSTLRLDGAAQTARGTTATTTATVGPITTTGNNTLIFAFACPQTIKHFTAGAAGWNPTLLTGPGQGCDQWQAFTSGQSGLSTNFTLASAATFNWIMFGLKGGH
jgi:hypothetical protein